LSESKSYTDNSITILRQLFGDNRAEWPSKHFKELFVQPVYLKKLESVRPCFLVGGRGTGKTTSLQSLKFDSTLERLESNGLSFGDQEFLGILVRMNKNRVRAFAGSGVEVEQWGKAFAHYFNLLVCLEFTSLGIWLENKSEKKIQAEDVKRISKDLGLDLVHDLQELHKKIRDGISELQIYVNNPNSKQEIVFSMAEVPLRTFSEVLTESKLAGDRVIFCCIDEYENLLDSQQAIVNTYIKHAEPPLSYKIGVRKNGFRNRQTLDDNDLLKTPDDYADIEIVDEGFEFFANAVAELRLKCAKEQGVPVPEALNDFLEELSFAEEAELLGSEKIAKEVLRELEKLDLNLFSFFTNKSANEVYFLKYWQEKTNGDLSTLANDWLKDDGVWKTRIGNHGYASLYWLSKGNKGKRIHKYYSGARVLFSLAAGNIRFFLELIDVAIGKQLDQQNNLNDTKLVISAKSQTLAARDVGLLRINQLEGLADHGVQLKRLVLAIGKVFFEFARNPLERTPEVTSFVLSGDRMDKETIQNLLADGVGHLAFEATPRTKATTNLELRDEEYRLHRIFCAFFEISHRKKRRVTFSAKELLNILEDKPSKAISSLLEGRNQSKEEDLPEQLAFFNAFYDDGEK
jgi:hypothetical protein